VRCRTCGAASRATARFCDQCGSRLSATRAGRSKLPPIATGIEQGDRRIVTAVFADLVDYVRLVAEHDPEEVRARVDSALTAMGEAIEQYDGTREKFIGDAVFAVFGWPVGHDDDALRAAHCALAIREALAHVGDPAAGAPLEVRIGLATGEVVAAPRGAPGSLDWSLTGPAVTTAARIQALAQPGEILLDEATVRAARKGLEVEDRGPQVLRGQSRPVRVARLLGEAGFQPWRPPVGRFVGRHEERARLRKLLVDRHGGEALIVEGDAGMGKSRLMADLADDARAAGFAWTWVDNVSYGAREPYRWGRALAQAIANEHTTDSGTMARRLLFTPDASPRQVRLWGGAVAAIARDAAFSGWEAEAPLVPHQPARVARAVRELAIRYSERLVEVFGPRVIVIDDLQWLDPSSAGMVDELIRLTSRLRLILLFGMRPQTESTIPSIAGLERVRLAGLDESHTGKLAAAVAGTSVDPADARRLHQRTAGNPLFITETVRAVLDDASPTNGRLNLEGSGSQRQSVPVTIRALLGARIDALSENAREILRMASVVGMNFRETFVDEIVGHAVDPAIYGRLSEASLIVQLDGAGGWRFGHPLIHEAAYAGLLATRRRQVHSRVADRLEASTSREAIGVVARHRAAAGDRDRAVPLLIEAAEEALAVGAPEEAAQFWTAAAELLGSEPAAEECRRRAREALEVTARA
jgi:class 3 adenylate cyclase